ncbi:MAG: right-handed parallel beta-helix repeat-containing protein [Phycisphaerales bacterium]|nr:MAG: right-handed parallel beta-helix repeat-containing protein [Phycisphaerales bacterium]
MTKRLLTLLALCCLLGAAQTCCAEVWYVDPDGRSGNAGTADAPWDIGSALGGRQKVEAGDTLYLTAGTYRRRPNELFEVRLVGSAEHPIQVRPAAGQRARIDGGLSVQSPSQHVWIRDLEILVSEPLPHKPVSPGSHPKDLSRPAGGLHMHGGKGCKYINLIIHNCNQGISCWKNELNPEIYGCIIYDNGWLGTDRGHGHCIYTQNEEGVKLISNCIMSCRFDGTYTLHAYGSERAYVDNFLAEKNVCYGKGPFLIGGGRPSHNIRVFGNYLYDVDMRIGYSAPYNEDCEIRDNTIVNGGLNVVRYRNVRRQGNLVIPKDGQRPAGVKTILLPNRFDENRAHLVIYNWAKAKKVEVRAERFLKDGEPFRLKDPKDFHGPAVARGKCRAGKITAPAESEFAVFVVLRGG